MGITYARLLEVYSGVILPKMIEIGWHLTKLLQKKTKKVQFFYRHSVNEVGVVHWSPTDVLSTGWRSLFAVYGVVW